MPLALLLQGLIKTIAQGAKRLAPWAVMAEMEELLIDRARGAFIVHWFGTAVPLEGLHLRIAIANLDELRSRFNEVLAEYNRRRIPNGLNLIEPLAGMTGAIVGTLLTPTGQLMIMVAIQNQINTWWQSILLMLNWISGGVPSSGILLAVGVIALPLVLLAPLMLVLTQPEAVRSAFGFMAALARAIDASTQLIHILLGPREAIRNPLTRRILEIADQIANVTLPLIAAFAILITRVGPVLERLPAQMRGFYDLFEIAKEITLTIINDLVDRLQSLYQGRNSPFNALLRLIDILVTQLPQIGTDLSSLMGEISAFMTAGWQSVQRAFGNGETDTMSYAGWFSTVWQEITMAFENHSTVQIILRLIDVLTLAVPHLRSTSSSSSSSGGFTDRFLPPTLPTFPDLPNLPDADALLNRLDVPPDLNLSTIQLFADLLAPFRDEASTDLSRRLQSLARRRPRSYFSEERQAVDAAILAQQQQGLDQFGSTTATALQALYDQEIPFSQALRDIVAAQARDYIAQLRAVFGAIENDLTQISLEALPRELFPVRSIPEVERLQPDIGALRIRVTGGEQVAANEWGRSLQAALLSQDYRVELVTQVGG